MGTCEPPGCYSVHDGLSVWVWCPFVSGGYDSLGGYDSFSGGCRSIFNGVMFIGNTCDKSSVTTDNQDLVQPNQGPPVNVSEYKPTIFQNVRDWYIAQDYSFRKWVQTSKVASAVPCVVAPGAVSDIHALNNILLNPKDQPVDNSDLSGGGGAIWVKNINTQRHGGFSTVGSADAATKMNALSAVADYAASVPPCITKK